jgi:hypothetical protein
MAELGHASLALLKADIEGAEYDVFGFWAAGGGGALPRQVSVELHSDWLYHGTSADRNPRDFSNLFWPMHQVSAAELALFVGHMAGLGYGIVSKEDNPICTHCSELTLLHVGA